MGITIHYPQLYGLVLAGGKSTRMGEDKSLLNYHGKPQVAHCFDLLSKCCKKVFISNRFDQADLPGHRNLPIIQDKYDNIGPIGGILTALENYPQNAWLVLGCDLPFVDEEGLRDIIDNRDPSKTCTAYTGVHKPGPEPLCAIYEPSLLPIIQKFVISGIRCPRKILMNSNIKMIPLKNTNLLANINEPNEYKEAINRLLN